MKPDAKPHLGTNMEQEIKSQKTVNSLKHSSQGDIYSRFKIDRATALNECSIVQVCSLIDFFVAFWPYPMTTN